MDRVKERIRIGQRIAEIRKEVGLSQTQLGNKCGIERCHISRIEQGKYSVGLDTLATIAEAMGKTLDFV